MIGLPLIGWAMLSAGGYPVRLTAGFALPPIVPQDALAYGLLRQAHGLIAFAFSALILVHPTTSPLHGFVPRAGAPETMRFSRPPPPTPPPAPAPPTPPQ